MSEAGFVVGALTLAIFGLAVLAGGHPVETVPEVGITRDFARQLSEGFVAAFPGFADATLDPASGVVTFPAGDQLGLGVIFQSWENLVNSFIPILTTHTEVAHLWNLFAAQGVVLGAGFDAGLGLDTVNTWLANIAQYATPPEFLMTQLASGGQAVLWDTVKGY